MGTGDKVVRLHEDIHKEMRKKRIALEVQDTVSELQIFVRTSKGRQLKTGICTV